MPHAEIMSANSGKAYKAPHERMDGPFEDYELEDAGRTMERADQIKSNPKLVEAIARHHEKKAKRHRKLAETLRPHMKRGLVSESALEKVSKHRHA